MGILYESYIHPLTILSTLPSAGVGALLALYVTGGEFSLISLLGLFLLIGVVKKNAILMIDLALQLERHQGFSPEESIRQACLLRLRPILMTTLAAILGALPLLLSQAEGAEMRQPLGLTIIGGLVFSQILTLYTTPVVYLYLDRLRHRFNRWRGVRTDAPWKPRYDFCPDPTSPCPAGTDPWPWLAPAWCRVVRGLAQCLYPEPGLPPPRAEQHGGAVQACRRLDPGLAVRRHRPWRLVGNLR